MHPTKSSPESIARASAWNLAHPERRREIALKSYLKTRPELKPVPTTQERFERLYMAVPESGCWLWLGSVNKDGYGKVKVEGKNLTAHRWSWMINRSEIPHGMQVLHRCDVTYCVNPNHLFIGTNQDNVYDKEKKGRGYHTPPPVRTKLSDDDVREIRRLRGKITVVGLGKRFGIDHSQISRIQRGKCFVNIPMDQEV